MFDVMSFKEIDGQHAELLPARTVMQTGPAGGGGSDPVAELLGGSGGQSDPVAELLGGLPAPLGGLIGG